MVFLWELFSHIIWCSKVKIAFYTILQGRYTPKWVIGAFQENPILCVFL